MLILVDNYLKNHGQIDVSTFVCNISVLWMVSSSSSANLNNEKIFYLIENSAIALNDDL